VKVQQDESATGVVGEVETREPGGDRSPARGPGPETERGLTRLQIFGAIAGPLLFVAMVLAPAPEGLSLAGWRTAAVAVLMAIWWMTEMIPISATALLPLVLFPILGVETIQATAAPYAQPMIFLFMGGFMIALAMQRWGLHRRIALNIIRVIGTRPGSIITGFMVSSAFLSMWVSNTATTMMMLPIGLSVIELARRSDGVDGSSAQHSRNFGICLMLSIAYASSIGGVGTLVGTPTNALLAGFMAESFGFEIDFVHWMAVGLPLVLVGLPVVHFALTRIAYPLRMKTLPGGREYVDAEIHRLGRISRPETMVAGVFGLVATLWIFQPLLSEYVTGLSDAGIAIFGAILLFMLPVSLKRGVFLMNWKYAEQLPWGVLILFGGGLTLAGAIQRTGLAEWLGGFFEVIGGWPVILVIGAAAMLIIILTELTSNSATAAAFLPIMVAVAVGIGENPLLLAVPVTIAASCAFMLPVATPPNAIVYGSGIMTIPQMARAGIVLNILFVFIITILAYTVVGYVFGVQLGVVPDWALAR
jgi:solute carrier family 13 (sodium-dependent dicarboxylate transporter), member 2/3/5